MTITTGPIDSYYKNNKSWIQYKKGLKPGDVLVANAGRKFRTMHFEIVREVDPWDLRGMWHFNEPGVDDAYYEVKVTVIDATAKR